MRPRGLQPPAAPDHAGRNDERVMETYPEMNREIVKLLRIGNDAPSLYAAARIEELEAEVERLKGILDPQIEWGIETAAHVAHLLSENGTLKAEVERLTKVVRTLRTDRRSVQRQLERR